MSRLGLGRGSLLFSLFGFTIGIEITQLLVVALIMPSLVVLSRTPWYTPFRLAVAGSGLVLSMAWMLERGTVTPADPFAPATEWLVAHPFVVAAAVALLAAAGREASPDRQEGSGPVALPGRAETRGR